MINDTIKSVKGIIILNKRYLLQLRDNKKNIYFPNFWGLFGGRVDIGETNINALRREIKEEINLVVKVKQKILSTTYNMIGLKKKRKLIYYECNKIKNTKMILTEGQRFKLFRFDELNKLSNTDGFCIINTHHYYLNNYTSLYR